jgi:metal-responsive CopG/Arc/MetJ family transcriptional regulator
MRTTLNLKNDLIKKVLELTGAKNRSQAINDVLEYFIKEKQINNLLGLKGKLHLDENLEDLREMELDER